MTAAGTEYPRAGRYPPLATSSQTPRAWETGLEDYTPSPAPSMSAYLLPWGLHGLPICRRFIGSKGVIHNVPWFSSFAKANVMNCGPDCPALGTYLR